MPSHRIVDPELLDDPNIPSDLALSAYEQLSFVERLLGITAEVFRVLNSHRPRPCRVVDIGCGNGHLMKLIREKLRISVAGVDLRRLNSGASEPYTYVRDATVQPIPKCDVAICIFVAHHLTDQKLENLIESVGASADRLVIVDPVRSLIPKLLFQTALVPWLSPVVASDGLTSIRNSFTIEEFASIASRTRLRWAATVSHTVAFLQRYQVLDIRYRQRNQSDTGHSQEQE